MVVNCLFRHRVKRVCWFSPHPLDNGSVGFVDFQYNRNSPWQCIGVVVSSLAPPIFVPVLIGWGIALTWPGVVAHDAWVDLPVHLFTGSWQQQMVLLCGLLVGLHAAASRADYRTAVCGMRDALSAPVKAWGQALLLPTTVVLLALLVGIKSDKLIHVFAELFRRFAALWEMGMISVVESYVLVFMMSIIVRGLSRQKRT